MPDTVPTPEQREQVVLLASLAPSVHITQPWLFADTPDGLLLLRDRTRRLDVLDPDERDLLLSCGAALHHAGAAARALGLAVEVDVLPAHEGPDVVARLRLRPGPDATLAEVAEAVSISRRHTSRGRFPDAPVPDQLVGQLRAAAEQRGATLRLVHPDEVVEVQVLVSRAEQHLHRTPGYDDELRDWVWRGEGDPERGDGMPAAAVDHGPGRAESLQGREFAGALPRPDEPPAHEAVTAVVLCTPGDTAADQVHAGQALSALMLAATRAELLVQPLSQVVDVPSERAALQVLLGTVGVPQMLLRLGVGTATGTSPRRPTSEMYAASVSS